MKQTVTKCDFVDAFHNMGRGDQFSYEALTALYDYYTELEEDIGEEIELDPIAICCDWSEYDCFCYAKKDYGIDNRESLEDHTTVIELASGRVLVQCF